jgi:hypothetical protein
MLTNIWIIESRSAICVFEANFKKLKIDSDMIAGFLVAILNFAKELADKDIKSITLSGMKITYNVRKGFIIASAFTDNTSEIETKELLDKISSEFEHRFSKVISPFSGNTAQFDSFAPYVEDLLHLRSIKIEMFKSKVINELGSEVDEDDYEEFKD